MKPPIAPPKDTPLELFDLFAAPCIPLLRCPPIVWPVLAFVSSLAASYPAFDTKPPTAPPIVAAAITPPAPELVGFPLFSVGP